MWWGRRQSCRYTALIRTPTFLNRSAISSRVTAGASRPTYKRVEPLYIVLFLKLVLPRMLVLASTRTPVGSVDPISCNRTHTHALSLSRSLVPLFPSGRAHKHVFVAPRQDAHDDTLRRRQHRRRLVSRDKRRSFAPLPIHSDQSRRVSASKWVRIER